MEGWLCTALFKYFETAPEHLYARAEPLLIGRERELGAAKTLRHEGTTVQLHCLLRAAFLSTRLRASRRGSREQFVDGAQEPADAGDFAFADDVVRLSAAVEVVVAGAAP